MKRSNRAITVITVFMLLLATVYAACNQANEQKETERYAIDINYPKPERGAGIIRVYKQEVPAMRFVGKKDGTGGSTGDWGLWWENDWFGDIERAAGLDAIRALYEDSDGYLDMYCITAEGPLEHWVGMFVPPGSPVPDDFQYVDFPAGSMGTCWIYGNTSNVWGQRSKCMEALVNAGMRIKPAPDGAIWYMNRYPHRYLDEDEKGNIILDVCYFVK